MRTCKNCRHYDGSHKCNNEHSIAWMTPNRVYEDDCCNDHQTIKENKAELRELFKICKLINEQVQNETNKGNI